MKADGCRPCDRRWLRLACVVSKYVQRMGCYDGLGFGLDSGRLHVSEGRKGLAALAWLCWGLVLTLFICNATAHPAAQCGVPVSVRYFCLE